MLIFRQLFDQKSSTYTYLLGDSDSSEAIMIDTVFEQKLRDLALLKELNLTLKYVVDTHCHADHVTAAWLLKKQTGAEIVISKYADVTNCDLEVEENQKLYFGERYITVKETPGHTKGCVTYVLDDESMAFTGDALLIRGCGRTDFQQGSSNSLYESIHSKIFSLPDETLLYPGHDYRGLLVTSVAEEKKYNPRLGGNLSESDFNGFMNNLNLAHPKQIDIALPANLKSGKPDNLEMHEHSQWAQVQYSFAGIPEIEPQNLEEVIDKIQLIDVREKYEFNDEMGHIQNAKHIPLGELNDRINEIDIDLPIVTVCRAGGRSAQATNILKNIGFPRFASLSGGMLRWCSESYPTVKETHYNK